MSLSPWMRASLLPLVTLPLFAGGAAAQVPVFDDGFTSGSNCAWSVAQPTTAQPIGLGATAGDTTVGSTESTPFARQAGPERRSTRFDAPDSALLNLSLVPQSGVGPRIRVVSDLRPT